MHNAFGYWLIILLPTYEYTYPDLITNVYILKYCMPIGLLDAFISYYIMLQITYFITFSNPENPDFFHKHFLRKSGVFSPHHKHPPNKMEHDFKSPTVWDKSSILLYNPLLQHTESQNFESRML